MKNKKNRFDTNEKNNWMEIQKNGCLEIKTEFKKRGFDRNT